ncbi:MAG: hypothetical protein WDO24_30370 [Pseudomonadota bacterium]
MLDISAAAIELKLDHVVERLSEVAETVGAQAGGEAGLRLGGASGEIEHKLDLVIERLAQVAVALGAVAERRGEASDAAAASGWAGALGDRLDQLGGALATQATDSAAAIKQLYATVDSLCLSVAPVLNRLADTQEDLLAALSGEHTTSRLLANVAEDLRQLSHTNRDTLDRHMQLATELAKVGQTLEGVAAVSQPRPVQGAKSFRWADARAARPADRDR